MTRKIALLACLYFAQGLPYGFFTQSLPALMRQQGFSLAEIGLTSLLFVPWALKFLWAPLVDRYGQRKSWIIPLQVTASLILCGVAFLRVDGHFDLILGLVLLVNLLSATQDIATDGLAVDMLTPEERGLGNGVQVAGYRFGMILGGGVLLMALAWLGWRNAFLLMAGGLLLAAVPIVLHRERPVADRPEGPAMRAAVWAYFRRPGAWRWAAVLVLYKAFDALAKPIVKPMMVDQGYDLADIGLMAGLVASVAGLVGALAGGVAVKRFGRRPALLWFGVLQALAVGAYAVPALGLGGQASLFGAFIADEVAGSLATVALFTLMMDRCSPASSATDYTIQASVVVVAVGVTSTVSGAIAQAFLHNAALGGYAGFYVLVAALTLVGVIGALRLFPREESWPSQSTQAPLTR